MKKFTLPALSSLALLSLGALASEARMVGHYSANGARADFSVYGEDKSYQHLTVEQSGTSGPNGSTKTYVNYYSGSCDFEAGTCRNDYAYGEIPNKDFNPGPKSATLNTNTASNPGLVAVHSVCDMSTWICTDTPISLGIISLAWKASGESSYRTVGNSTITHANFTWKSVGQSSGSGAFVTGTIAGEAVNAFEANIGTSSNNETTIERK